MAFRDHFSQDQSGESLSILNLGEIKKQIEIKVSQLVVRDFVTILLIVLVVSLIGGMFQIVYLGWPFNQFLSAPANDLPAVRPGAIKIQMNFGVHYFGDFLQPLDWARQANPWTSDPKYLAQYPPFAIYILKPFTLLPYRISALIYLSLMIASSIFGIWLFTKKFIWSNRVLIVLIFGISSVPFLMAFDRGNLVGFFVLLFSLFIYGIQTNKRLLTWIALGLMISIKIYPVLLVLVLLRLKQFKEAIFAVLFSVFVTLLLFALTPGSFLETISQFVAANVGGLDIQGERQIRTFAQFTRLFINAPDAILQSWDLARIANSYFNFFRIGLLLVSTLLIVTIPKLTLRGIVLLSCIAMTTLNSSQLGYNWFWAPVFVVWLIADHSIKVRENDVFPTSSAWNTEKYAVIAGIGFCVLSIPTGLHVPGSSTPLTPYLGLLTSTVAMLYLLIENRKINLRLRKPISVI